MARNVHPEIVKFLKSVSTATRYMEFMSLERFDQLPKKDSAYIGELEDLLSRLSLEAEALLVKAKVGGKQ